MSAYEQLSYSGWRRERFGPFAGLQAWQVICVAVLLLPVLVAAGSGSWATAVRWALVVGLPGTALVTVPVRGRPAVRWVADGLLFLGGRLTGWSMFRSATATGAGSSVDLEEPDLPGSLARLRFHDGPPYGPSMTPVCVVEDPVTGRWAATARLTHPGVARADGATRDGFARALGGLLASAASAESISRISLAIRTVPDDGTARSAWVADHLAPDGPRVALRAAAGMERVMAATAVRHEMYLTVAIAGDATRKAAKDAGGGVAGRARVLHRHLQELEGALQGVGVTGVEWLDGQGLAAVVRTGFNPAVAAELGRAAEAALRDPDVAVGVPWAAAGPAAALPPAPRSYTHDSCTSVAYALLLPSQPTRVGAMSALLATGDPRVRRCLAMHYEPVAADRAQRQARNAAWADVTSAELKTSKGFRVSWAERRRASENARHEQALAAGHAAVRVAGAVAVTVPAGVAVEDHAAGIEADARRAGFILRRLELAQDSGFVAACLPLGIGLPDRAGR